MNLPIAQSFTAFYYWMLGALCLTLVIGTVFLRSRAGYAIAAIRENQDAARALGIAPLPYKVLAYASSASVFGVVGGVYAYWFTFIDPPTVFDSDFTIQAIVMALFGGDTVVLLTQFDPVEVWKAIERRKVNVVVLIGDAMARPMIEAFHQGLRELGYVEG